VDSLSGIDQRDVLIESIERHEQALRQAVHELTGAASVQLQISKRIKQAPLPWLLAGFLVGMWLGGGHDHRNG
jgi:hypothetical protein